MPLKFSSTATISLLLIALLISLKYEPRKDDITPFEFVPIPKAVGPESYAFDRFGEGPYTGVSDGRIIKWVENQRRWIDFAFTSPNRTSCEGLHDHHETEHVCGRPLGLRFDKTGNELYIADAYMGLLKVGPNGGLATRVVNQVKGVPLSFSNGIDIDHDTGVVYFTDSSSRYQRRNYLSLILSADKTGRLIQYNPQSGQVDVLLDNLTFPNGVALSKNGDFLLVAETTACRITRFWLRTPKAGTHEVFADDLPGFPDNVKRSPRGGFWVAIHSRKTRIFKWLLSRPRVARGILDLPFDVTRAYTRAAKGRAKGLLIRVGEDGDVLEVFEDLSGVKWNAVSEVEERDGNLWIGSIHKPYAGKLKLNVTHNNNNVK